MSLPKLKILERTSKMISQACQILDSEKAYNEHNLDAHLMGIKSATFSKKKKAVLKHPPSQLPRKPKKKLSKSDEEQYEYFAQKI